MNLFKPSSLRQSVLLISTAILMSVITVQAQTKPAKLTQPSAPEPSDDIKIGRLPSFHAGDGQVVGVKPNVFLVIDNSAAMASDGNEKYAPTGNYLQQISGALIASLPQLENKVRLAYSTSFRGVHGVGRFNRGGCDVFKLNGNVDKVVPLIPGLKEDLEANKKYVTGKEDFVFNDSGSGYGDTVPRDFKGNFASYVYAWLGALCVGGTTSDSIKYIYVPQPQDGVPPYADLSDPVAYKAAAKASGNKNSYPLYNFFTNNALSRNHNPLLDIYAKMLGEVSDESFICSIMQSRKAGDRICGYTDLAAEKSSPAGVTLRSFPGAKPWDYIKYDAYATARDDRYGFPDDKNPLSCRKNYTIMVTYGAYGNVGELANNRYIGNERGLDGKIRLTESFLSWRLPNGRDFPLTGPLGDFTRIYRSFPYNNNALERVTTEVKPFNFYGTSNVQGSRTKFMLSKLALQTYYRDLRSNLPDDVPQYIAPRQRGRKGPNGRPIPPYWDRKNDTANWQHMTFFALGFGQGFDSWRSAEIYNKNYDDIDTDKEGLLEGYFRAVEDGTIYEANKPLYDWSRGGWNHKNEALNVYIYKNPTTKQSEKITMHEYYSGGDDELNALDALQQMDYAKAGMIGRGGAYMISDYNSIKNVIKSIADRIETAMAQGISGGAISGGGRVTASQQAAGGNDSILFTTYLDQENASGNIFAFKNCPLIKQMIYDEDGNVRENPDWVENNCGKRLWNAASALYDSVDTLGSKTIIPVEKAGELSGATFDWSNLDQKLKDQLSKGGNEALGKARVEWLNGKLQSQLDPSVANKLRTRSQIFIPDEKQNYKRNPDGSLEKDQDGNIVLADPTNIPNLMGDVVYALPKAVDNRGTLPAAHPLHNQTYVDFLETTVKNRKPLVLAGSNDGRLYGFSVARTGQTVNESENAALAFSYIPRQVITKKGDNLVSYTTEEGLANIKGGFADGLVNGPFTVRDAQVNDKWGTYVVGTLGEGGDAIYALDISNGRASSDIFKWEVSGRGYGNIMAEPRIIWLRAKDSATGEPNGKWVVILPTGYNAKTVSLVILDLADGTELAKINTAARFTSPKPLVISGGTKTCNLTPLSKEEEKNLNTKAVWEKLETIGSANIPSSLSCSNGLGQLTVFDADSDGGADTVFAGDLLGHVWKFDLSGFFDSSGNQALNLNITLKVAYDSPLFIAQTPLQTDEISTRQPITSMIEIDDGAYGEGSMLYFGTGRMLNQEERKLSQQESFYSIWDIPRYFNKELISLPLRRNLELITEGTTYDFIRYTTVVIPSSDVIDKQNSSLTEEFKELRGVKRTDELKSSEYLSINLEKKYSPDKKAVGWIIDFPSENAFERVINRAYSFEDTIFFSTFSPKGGSQGESCQPERSAVGGDARFYMVDRLTGGQLETSPFDFNNDGIQNDQDGVAVSQGNLGENVVYENKKPLNLDQCKDKDSPESCVFPLSPAGLLLKAGSGDFLSITGVLERAKQAQSSNCDYSRQIIFPSTVDPATGNPLVLSSCNRNRYRVWKQPMLE